MSDSLIGEKDLFLCQNKLIFKKYKPIKLIGKGTFSNVYLSLNTKKNSYVAIKAEKRNPRGVELLESEAFLLYSLKGFGIPTVLSYGRTKIYNILVQPLLGKSLLDFFISKNKNININDICLIAIQILERIEWVHSNNIVYRDIKPENFLFGKKDPEILYLIDFGLCRKYKSSNTGKHISPKNLGKFTGTSRYASLYAMAGNEQSRRDDIESIGYMIIFLIKKKLPWQGIKGHSYKECYHKLYLMKKYIKIEELCKGLPKEIIDYMINAKSLKFEQEPNYMYLKNLFYNILKKNNYNIENKLFSWIKKIDINRINLKSLSKSNSQRKTPNNKMIRKSSPQNRLYNKIKSSIENKNKILLIKQSQNNDKTDYTSSNTDNKNSNSEKFNSEKIIRIKMLKNDENSWVSNEVMVDKKINSNYNDNIENFPRFNSEHNIYHENIISNKMNEIKKQIEKKHSPQNNRLNNLFYTNKHKFSNVKNFEDENSRNINNNKNFYNNNKEIELKKIYFLKNNRFNNNINNQAGKIIKIYPIKNDNNTNKSISHINKNNNDINNYYKTNHIKILQTNNNIESINNKISISNKQNTTDNITYNTYNTYNTFNSFNDTQDKANPYNNYSINIPHSEMIEHNYQNNRRINHIIYQKNNHQYFKTNINTNKSDLIIDSPIIKNNQNKLIYLNNIEFKRELSSVNLRNKPIINKRNVILTHFNNRFNNSANKSENKSFLTNNGSIKKINNNNMYLVKKNIEPKRMKQINIFNNRININNISNLKLRQNNSYNNINKNNLKRNINNYKSKNSNIKENIVKTEINNETFKNQNKNSLKKIFFTNNKNNLFNKIENNYYIRLDKMKNNINQNHINPIQNKVNIYKLNQNNIKSKFNNNIIPNYNNYKNNTLKKIPNNNNLLFKGSFQPLKYKTENDSNSFLIHKNINNLHIINNEFLIKENDSMKIIKNKNIYNITNKQNINSNISDIKQKKEKYILDEIESKDISPKKNLIANKSNNISTNLFADGKYWRK